MSISKSSDAGLSWPWLLLDSVDFDRFVLHDSHDDGNEHVSAGEDSRCKVKANRIGEEKINHSV